VVALSNVKVSAINFVRLMGCRDVDTDSDEEVIDDETKPITVQIPKPIVTAAAVPLLIKSEKLICSRGFNVRRLYVLLLQWFMMSCRDIQVQKIQVQRTRM
jgi:hypothetical protein